MKKVVIITVMKIYKIEADENDFLPKVVLDFYENKSLETEPEAIVIDFDDGEADRPDLLGEAWGQTEN